MDADTPTGVHPLLDSEDAEYDAFCLMDFEDGGWTLVARSRSGAQDVPFGWRSQRGSVDDAGDAYSLDVWGKGLEFTEILVADRSGREFVPFERAYVLVVMPSFIEDHEDNTVEHESIETVLGDCVPTGGPAMLRYLGYTGRDQSFFMRDMTGEDGHGLQADGWTLAHNNCNQGGVMNGSQGLIYVR